MQWDVFISYAGEDKEQVAAPLADRLTALGFNVWYADRILKLGDSLREKIDEGLANSRYGVVILSHAFFKKHWPRKELDALAALQAERGNPILPVLHEMKQSDLVQHSPLLASVLHTSTDIGLDAIAKKIGEVLLSAPVRLLLDKATMLTFLKKSLSADVEQYLYLSAQKENLVAHVVTDASLLLTDLYPRLNEYKGTRASHLPPEKDYLNVVHRTRAIFENIEVLVRSFLAVYCRQVQNVPLLAETIQGFARLTLFDIHMYTTRLLPLGRMEDWFLEEYAPIWKVLRKWTKLQYANPYGQDLAMRAHLLGFQTDSPCLDLAGRKGIYDITRLCIPENTLSPYTQGRLAAGLYLAPDAEISLPDWLRYWLPQVLHFHAVSAADCDVNLTQSIQDVGLLKSDYWRMGYH